MRHPLKIPIFFKETICISSKPITTLTHPKKRSPRSLKFISHMHTQQNYTHTHTHRTHDLFVLFRRVQQLASRVPGDSHRARRERESQPEFLPSGASIVARAYSREKGRRLSLSLSLTLYIADWKITAREQLLAAICSNLRLCKHILPSFFSSRR